MKMIVKLIKTLPKPIHPKILATNKQSKYPKEPSPLIPHISFKTGFTAINISMFVLIT